MEVQFANADLDRMEIDRKFSNGFGPEIVSAYRKRVQFIRDAKDERDLYAVRSLHFEKLKGERSHQHSIRLNDQWRLIVEIRKGNPKNILHIVEIKDYH